MTEVVFSSENISVLGGPSSVDVSVDYGSQGVRGSYIFTGPGRPTDPDVEFPTPNIYDLFINLKPSDNEYLYLYQYININGVPTWVKSLRLIPNTGLANTPIMFFNGDAITFRDVNGIPAIPQIDLSTIVPSPVEPEVLVNGLLWLDLSTNPYEVKQYVELSETWVTLGTVTTGLQFPLGQFFALSDLGTIQAQNFNVQYNILSSSPIASGLSLGEITEFGEELLLPVFLKASELNTTTSTWSNVTGVRTIHIVVTAGIGGL